MPTIRSLKAKGKHAFNLTFLESDETLTLHRETIIAHRLFHVDRLDERQLKKIKEDDAVHRALEVSLKALARQNQTERALHAMLKRRGYHGDTISKALKTLTSNGYLDEAKALDAWLEVFFSTALKGPRYLKQKLEQDGYRPALIDDALARYDETIEKAKLDAFLSQAARAIGAGTKRDRARKLAARAINAGFSPAGVFEAAQTVVDATHDADAEAAQLKRHYEKLRQQHDLRNRKEKDKLIQKLMRKGYAYDIITSIIESEE